VQPEEGGGRRAAIEGGMSPSGDHALFREQQPEGETSPPTMLSGRVLKGEGHYEKRRIRGVALSSTRGGHDL